MTAPPKDDRRAWLAEATAVAALLGLALMLPLGTFSVPRGVQAAVVVAWLSGLGVAAGSRPQGGGFERTLRRAALATLVAAVVEPLVLLVTLSP